MKKSYGVRGSLTAKLLLDSPASIPEPSSVFSGSLVSAANCCMRISIASKKEFTTSSSRNPEPLVNSPTHVSSVLVMLSSPVVFFMTLGNGGTVFELSDTSHTFPSSPSPTPRLSGVLSWTSLDTEYMICMNVSRCAIIILEKFSTLGYHVMAARSLSFSSFLLFSLALSMSFLLESSFRALILLFM